MNAWPWPQLCDSRSSTCVRHVRNPPAPVEVGFTRAARRRSARCWREADRMSVIPHACAAARNLARRRRGARQSDRPCAWTERSAKSCLRTVAAAYVRWAIRAARRWLLLPATRQPPSLDHPRAAARPVTANHSDIAATAPRTRRPAAIRCTHMPTTPAFSTRSRRSGRRRGHSPGAWRAGASPPSIRSAAPHRADRSTARRGRRDKWLGVIMALRDPCGQPRNPAAVGAAVEPDAVARIWCSGTTRDRGDAGHAARSALAGDFRWP